jgi:hypothetical protein
VTFDDANGRGRRCSTTRGGWRHSTKQMGGSPTFANAGRGGDEQERAARATLRQHPHPCYKREMVGSSFFLFFFSVMFFFAC